MNYNIVLVDRESVIAGDVIICDDGVMRTVCKKDITWSNFTGICIFGSSYKLGYEKVKKVVDLKF